MTIDEAIENLKEDYEIDMYIRDIAPQLAEWLEELKELREKAECARCVYNCCCHDELAYKSGYNKAIDDFSKFLVEHKIVDEDSMPEIIIDFNEEQLKAGGEND